MTTTLVGELTLQAALPFPGIAIALADLQLKLAAMLDFSVKIGLPALSITAQLQLAAQITASLQAALSIGITPPSISAQLTLVLDVIALLKLQLAFFDVLLATGVFVYVYEGPTNAFGGELGTALAAGFPGHGATDHANILVLGTVSAATWAAMSIVFKVSP